jgi:tetratricopeptide (TPR) repeat protein
MRPAVLHLAHGQQTEARTPAWRGLARLYARSLVDSENASAAPASWGDLLTLCREFAHATDAELESGARDQDVIRLSELSIPLIATNLTNIEDARVAALHTVVPPVLFENVEKRVEAGRALYQGLWEEDHECFDVAMQRYTTAVENAPLDAGVLSIYGNFLYRVGNFKDAASVLHRAVDLAPHSTNLLNSLGSALGRAGRTMEAVACFERVLAVDPMEWSGYYNLAMALYPLRRHEQVIARLEARLAATPDPNGQDCLNDIRERVAQIDRERSAPRDQHG